MSGNGKSPNVAQAGFEGIVWDVLGLEMMPGNGWGSGRGEKEICRRNGWEESAVSRNENRIEKEDFRNGITNEALLVVFSRAFRFVWSGFVNAKQMGLQSDVLS